MSVDPYIQAILAEHRGQLDVITNFCTAQQTRDQRLAQERAIDKFVQEQKERITVCDGASTSALREYLRQIDHAVYRVPTGQDANDFIIRSIRATATGDHLDEVDTFICTSQQIVSQDDLRHHINDTFLGRDEAKEEEQPPPTGIPEARAGWCPTST